MFDVVFKDALINGVIKDTTANALTVHDRFMSNVPNCLYSMRKAIVLHY